MRYLLLFPVLACLGACSTISYYTQSISGQMDILFKRQDINAILANQQTPASLKTSLQQATEIRQFASHQLHLPTNKSYLYYADLKRPYVVWNVFAAPEFSLTPKTWCYFIVGCVSYRGYFKESAARKTAEDLKHENYDVHVAGIAAYSTLGWFDDPLLNTMMHWQTRSLASLIFHELSHQIVYISSETAFNEAFATAVERLGTIQWLLHTKPDNLAPYLAFLEAQEQFRTLLLEARDELNDLYTSSIDNNEKRRRKAEIITNLKHRYENAKNDWPQGIHFDNWFSLPVNNARLTASMTYLQKVPAFYQLFLENNADWEKFFISVIAMDDMEKATRDQLIDDRLNNPTSLSIMVNLIKEKHPL